MKLRLAGFLVLVPTLALAHPGHGHTDVESWTHYLTEPLHVAMFGAIAVTAIAFVRARRRVRRRDRSP